MKTLTQSSRSYTFTSHFDYLDFTNHIDCDEINRQLSFLCTRKERQKTSECTDIKAKCKQTRHFRLVSKIQTNNFFSSYESLTSVNNFLIDYIKVQNQSLLLNSFCSSTKMALFQVSQSAIAKESKEPVESEV
jgi:hypothetical protein